MEVGGKDGGKASVTKLLAEVRMLRQWKLHVQQGNTELKELRLQTATKPHQLSLAGCCFLWEDALTEGGAVDLEDNLLPHHTLQLVCPHVMELNLHRGRTLDLVPLVIRFGSTAKHTGARVQ